MKNNKMSGLDFLANKINQDIVNEIEEIEKRNVEISEEYYEQMGPFIHKLNRELEQKKKKQTRERWMRTAAVFAVVFISLNAAALGTSEAYREKVFSLIYDNNQGSVSFYFDVKGEMVSGWSDYWAPTWLPDGFELTAAEENESGYFLVFKSSDGSQEIRLLEYSTDMGFSFDTETMQMDNLKIGLSDGYYFEDPEQNLCYLLMKKEKTLIIVEYMSENYNSDDVIKIAEFLKYEK